MNKQFLAIVGVLIAIVIAIGAVLTSRNTHNVGGINDYISGDFTVSYVGSWIGVPNFKLPSDTNGQLTEASIGACSTASSTLFSVANPFNGTNGTVSGTSTAYITLFGTTGATTTDFMVGTSTTTAAPPAASSDGLAVSTTTLGYNLLGANQIPSSTAFFLSSGNTRSFVLASTSLLANPYTNNAEIQVGPNERLNGFATSTYAGRNGATAAGLLNTVSSCTYKIVWYR